MTIIKLGKYTITKEDNLNFGLYETTNKGKFRGKQAEGTTEKLQGYYGYLNMAMSKIMHLELINTSHEYLDAKAILEAISTVESNLNDAYRHRPYDYIAKEN